MAKVVELGTLHSDSELPDVVIDYAQYTCQTETPTIVASSMAALLGVAPHGTYKDLIKAETLPNVAARTDGDTVAFIGMAAFCVMAKAITDSPNNSGYLTSRWKAHCASANLTYRDLLSRDVVGCLKDFQSRISTQPLVRELWARALLGKTQILNQGIRNQILMVWGNQGLRSYLLINQFVAAPSMALTLDGVYDQAVDFKKAWAELRERHKEDLPYATVLGLDVSRVHQKTYPDLYYCALYRAMKTGKVSKAYQVSQVETTINKNVLEATSLEMRNHGGTNIPLALDRLTALGFQASRRDFKRGRSASRRRSRSSSRSPSPGPSKRRAP